MELPSESAGISTPGGPVEISRARPTHAPVSQPEEVTDTEYHRERSTDTVAERHQEPAPAPEGLFTGDPVVDLENLVYYEHPELATARLYIHRNHGVTCRPHGKS